MKAFRLTGWIAFGLAILLLLFGTLQAFFGKALVDFLAGASDFILIVIASFVVTFTILVCLFNCLGEMEQKDIEKGKF